MKKIEVLKPNITKIVDYMDYKLYSTYWGIVAPFLQFSTILKRLR